MTTRTWVNRLVTKNDIKWHKNAYKAFKIHNIIAWNDKKL